LEGRGFEGPDGLDYLHLDLTHLGAERINSRLPLIREVAMKFVDIDPVEKSIPIRPVAHYSMGGIETNLDGATCVDGIWAAGEAACVSMHGANRLGSNSTAECLVWGGITGEQIAYRLKDMPEVPSPPEAKVKAAAEHIKELLAREGKEDLYELRKQLRATMDKKVAVFRDGERLQAALDKIREIKTQIQSAPVTDKSRVYNSNLFNALELENLLDLAEVTVAGAIARQESRGAHARRDFDTRNDEDWLKHTLAWRTEKGPRLEYKTVTIDTWKPVERKY
jgi:succinate dehydrogenase / fumarate reductase flavoprotein subunit